MGGRLGGIGVESTSAQRLLALLLQLLTGRLGLL
jgi:hypothetical protein